MSDSEWVKCEGLDPADTCPDTVRSEPGDAPTETVAERELRRLASEAIARELASVVAARQPREYTRPPATPPPPAPPPRACCHRDDPVDEARAFAWGVVLGCTVSALAVAFTVRLLCGV